MIVIILCIIFATIVVMWCGLRALTFVGFGVALILSIAWFIHHMTSHLNIHL